MRIAFTATDELSDAELTEELVFAAMAGDHRRIERFTQLLAEQRKRNVASGETSESCLDQAVLP